MRLITCLGPKTLMFAALASLGTGTFLWQILAPAPRSIIPGNWNGAVFSADCRYAAVRYTTNMPSFRESSGEIRVWDVLENRQLFAIPFEQIFPPAMSPNYALAFTPTADRFVTFGWGEVKTYTMPSGEPWQPDKPRAFPRDGVDDSPSWLVKDADGNLFVAVWYQKINTISVHDPWVGPEIAGFPCESWPEMYPGAMIEYRRDAKNRLREFPSGKVRLEYDRPPHVGGGRTEYFMPTPDCSKLVHIYGKVRVWHDGEETIHDLPADQIPVLSPDGVLLAALVHRVHAYRDWRAAILSKLGIKQRDSVFVIYDVTTDSQVVQLPQARGVRFSDDGKTLIVVTADALELYDVPLGKPWFRIVGAALAGGVLVFLIGQWLRWRQRRRVRKVQPVQPPMDSLQRN